MWLFGCVQEERLGHSGVESDGGASERRVSHMSGSSYRMAKSRDIDLNKEKIIRRCAVSCMPKSNKACDAAEHMRSPSSDS